MSRTRRDSHHGHWTPTKVRRAVQDDARAFVMIPPMYDAMGVEVPTYFQAMAARLKPLAGAWPPVPVKPMRRKRRRRW